MPTRKEASKIKQDWIEKRNQYLNSKINKLEEEIYERIVADFLAIAKEQEIRKKAGKQTVLNLTRLEKEIKQTMANGFPEIMRETVKAARAIGDFNHLYFSTMLDTNRLDQIRDETSRLIDKKLGIDQNGKIIRGGFVDKTIQSEKVQKEFIKETKRLLAANADAELLKSRLKTLILSSPERQGIVSRYYNTFSSNIVNNIDRNNGLIYADEVGLNYFYYTGGLILTSRSFCVERNGKIFSREQASRWKNSPFIKNMYRGKIAEYNPFLEPGGYGCLHTPDWITDELAKGQIREQNQKASERNQRFKERHDL